MCLEYSFVLIKCLFFAVVISGSAVIYKISFLSKSQESAIKFFSHKLSTNRLDFLTGHLLTGSKAGDYEELRERTYTKILSNGTLLLQHVKEDREGFYLCHASNGIGSGLGKVVQLKVNCE